MPEMVLPALGVDGDHAPALRHPAAPRDRLAMLDGLRFVAAVAVLFYHFTARTSPAWDGARTLDLFPGLHPFSRYGYLGVDLFFFISGFVILMTAWGSDVPRFFASRVGRLFPAYWAGVLLTGVMLIATHGSLKQMSPGTVLTNLTMTQTPFGVDHVDGAYWTLWVELRFYLLVAVMVLVGINRNRVIVVAMIWPLVGAIAQSNHNTFVSELLISGWSPYFAAGMLLFLIYREGWSPLLAGLAGFQLVLAMTRAMQYLGPVNANTGSKADPVVAAAVVAAAFVLVALVTTTALRRVSWRWLTTLGALTYPLYVLHEYWGWLVIQQVHERLSPGLSALLAAVAVILMAWLVHRLVERPLGPRLRRATLEGLQPPRAKSPASPAVD